MILKKTHAIHGKTSKLSIILAMVLFMPIFAIFLLAISHSSPIFTHLIDTVLWTYIKNSLILVIGVCSLAILWGIPAAWLIDRYEFFGHKIFSWALLLPLAIPSYLTAYIYSTLFDFAGPIQIYIRDYFGFKSSQDYWFFDIQSIEGAIFVMSLAFFPYIYWITKVNLSKQSKTQIDAAIMLGASPLRTLFQVIIPLARPSIVVGCTLIAMETLADFGTASYFSVWHITTAIYDVWLTYYDLSAAAKLSIILLIFVVIIISLEKYSRSKIKYSNSTDIKIQKIKLSPVKSFFAFLWCFLILFAGFLLPFFIITTNAVNYFYDTDWPVFYRILKQTLSVALSVATIATLFSLLIQSKQRLQPTKINQLTASISGLGYAVPGTVLAIGVLYTCTTIDNNINDLLEHLGFSRAGLIFSASVVCVGYGFLSRFSAVSLGNINAGFKQIPESLDKTAVIHGYSFRAILKRIFIPLLRNNLLTAFLLVLIESLKELSAAIILRPFNFHTLSTYIFEYMSAEDFERAALPAFILVLVGLPAVVFLIKLMETPQHE